jgi:hypothetical protein
MGDGKATKIIFPIELSRLASILTGRLAPSEPALPGKEPSLKELVAKNKGQIEKLVGKDMADALEKVILEDKGKKIVEAETA